MHDGDITYYTIQTQVFSRSPWVKPEKALRPVPDKAQVWFFASWDFFGRAMRPCKLVDGSPAPANRAASDEVQCVWARIDKHGWLTRRYAEAALRRLRTADDAGAFDCRGGYGRVEQAVRHRFRVVRIIVSQWTVVTSVGRPPRKSRTIGKSNKEGS